MTRVSGLHTGVLLGLAGVGLALMPQACSLNQEGELYSPSGGVAGSGAASSGGHESTSSGGGSTAGSSGTSGPTGSGGGSASSSGQGGAGGGGTAAGGAGGAGGTAGAGGAGGQGGNPDTCGDGTIDPGEECDDENQVPSDGCDDCQVICPAGAVEEPSTHHCYVLVTAEKNRDDAKNGCEGMGYYLAVITSADEQAFIKPLTAGDDRWIGALFLNNMWVWENGEPWGFTAWEAGQPSYNDICVETRGSTNVWNDDFCNELHDYICEWTPPGKKP